MSRSNRRAVACAFAITLVLSCEGNERRIATAQQQIRDLRNALAAYDLDLGTYPATLAPLETSFVGRNEHMFGPWIAKMPLDPWGRPYIYRQPPADARADPSILDVFSAGRDGVPGTADDVRAPP